MTPEIRALPPNTWSLAQLQEYFSDDAHFAETLRKNGEEVRQRMAELFSTLSSSLQSSTFDPAMASQRNLDGLLPLQIAILNGATHLIGPLCGEEKLAKFKEFVKQIEAQE